MPRIAALLASLFMLASLTACNTVEGAGEDIQEAGEEIEEAGS